jgi:hypothetical protein
MAVHETLAIWEFPQDAEYTAMVQFVLEEVGDPDAYALLLSSRDDVLAVQLASGEISGDPASRFYVQDRGGYVLVRREEWPPLQPGGGPRTMLTLREWPHRDRAA